MNTGLIGYKMLLACVLSVVLVTCHDHSKKLTIKHYIEPKKQAKLPEQAAFHKVSHKKWKLWKMSILAGSQLYG